MSEAANPPAANHDGSCADCASLRRTDCGAALPPGGPPAALVVVLGGGWDPRLRFACANSYCGNVAREVVHVDAGRCPPHDFLSGCDAYLYDQRGRRLLGAGEVDAAADPPTRVAWFPLVSPHQCPGNPEKTRGFSTLEARISVSLGPIRLLLGPLIISARVLEI